MKNKFCHKSASLFYSNSNSFLLSSQYKAEVFILLLLNQCLFASLSSLLDVTSKAEELIRCFSIPNCKTICTNGWIFSDGTSRITVAIIKYLNKYKKDFCAKHLS